MADSGIPAGQISRLRFALAVPMLGSLGLLATPSAWANAAHAHAATPLQRASRVLMGTQVDMVVYGASSSAPALQAAMERAFAHMQTLEAMMSRFRSDSVLQQINAQAGKAAVTVPPEMMAVLEQARSVWHASNGAFDPTVGALAAWRFEPGVQAMPSTAQISQALQHIGADKLQLSASNNTARLTQSGMALDLGGIAKLPILAAGLEALQAQGVENALINGGGDVVTMGLNQGKAWRIGIRDHASQANYWALWPLKAKAWWPPRAITSAVLSAMASATTTYSTPAPAGRPPRCMVLPWSPAMLRR